METSATLTKKPSAQFLNRAKAQRFHRIAKVMSGELHGFGAKVERVALDPNKACTDGKTIWIPIHLHDDERYNTVMQEAVLAHECAHHRYTDFVSWQNNVVAKIKAGKEDSLLHKMTNMLEDARINHLFGQDWAGSKKMMDFTHEVFMAQHQENTTDDSPAAQQAFVAMMSECIAGEAHWFTTPKVVDFMDEVRPMLLNAIKQRTTMDVIRQARRLVKMFRAAFNDDPETDNADFDGTSDDDLDHSDIERASEAQQQQGRNPEEAGRERFSDLQPPKPRPQPQPEESADVEDEDGDASGSGDAEGDESSESESGSEAGEGDEGDESSESGSGDAEGDDGEGKDTQSGSSDEVGDDSSETGEGGDGGESSDGDATGDETTEGDCPDGEPTESGSQADADGDGDLTDAEDSESGDDGTDALSGQSTDGLDFEEHWSDLLDKATDALDDDVGGAFDMEHDFHNELDNSTDKVDETTTLDSVHGEHNLEVTAGVREFHRRYHDLGTYADHYANVARQGRGAIRAITKEITRRLKGSDPRFDGGHKSGRLASKKVWKFGHADFDSSRVYQKKVDPADLKASAIILIDASGSMGRGEGSRAAHAANAAVIYSEVFQALGVDYEVIDFATAGSGTTMRVRKAFGSSATRMEKACIAMPSSGGVNADGFAVQWCLDRLDTRAGNRLLIAISDGAPSGHSPESMTSSEHLRTVTNNANESCAGVGLLGVGIAGTDTSSFYPNSVRVTNLSTMAQETLPTLRRILKKMIPKKG